MTTSGWQPSPLQRERDAYRRGRDRRSSLIATASLVVVAAAVVLVVANSPGWPAFRHSFLNFPVGWAGLPELLRAFWVNIQILLVSTVVILVIATLLAGIRTLRGPAWLPLRVLAVVYVDVFRGLPSLLVILLVGFGIPSLRIQGAPTSPFTLAIIALSLSYSAYVSEVLRAGIESVHPSQRAAARSLGLTYGQTLRHVVFPQAVRNVLPPLLNDFVSLQKDTSLVYFLGVIDIVLASQNEESGDYLFVHQVMAGLAFLAVTIPFTRFTDWIARRRGWLNSGGAKV